MRYQIVDEAPEQTSNQRYQFVDEESPLKSAMRTGYQVASGLAEASPFSYVPEIASTLGAKAQFASPEEAIGFMHTIKPEELESEREKRKLGEEQILKSALTKSNIEKTIEEKTGAPLTPQTDVQKALKLASSAFGFKSGPILEKAIAGGSAAGIREVLKQSGLSDEQSDSMALLLSQFNPAKAVKSLAEKKPETLPSGLEKPRAIEANFPKLATVSKEAQKEKLQSLNEAASELTKGVIEKRLPISKKIEAGHNFQEEFKEKFGKINKLAEDFRPQIEVIPIDEFMQTTSKKYQGIPNPHSDAKKILKEIDKQKKSSFNPNDLSNQLKIFRSNNRKRSDIFEQAYVKGSHKEYADWLKEHNDAIVKSIESAFPEDSSFVKMFKDANADYNHYMSALESKKILEPILGANPTPKNLVKLANDPKTVKKLQLAMGKQGAEEIGQIAKDLKLAKESIQQLPKTELTKFDQILPLGFLLDTAFPGIGKGIGIVYSAKKLAQFGYGRLLMNSKNRTSYREAIKAIVDNNPQAYSTAVSKFDKTEEE